MEYRRATLDPCEKWEVFSSYPELKNVKDSEFFNYLTHLDNNENFMVIDDKLFSITWIERFGANDYLNIIEHNHEDGSYTFETYHDADSVHWAEMVESSMRGINKSLNEFEEE